MIRILDICDDVLFHVISFLTPLDFLLLSQTCSHFHSFVDATKRSPMNKFWKQRCEQCWKLIKENNYKSRDNKYTYDILFQSMIEFIIEVLKLSAAKPLSNNDLLQKNLRMQKQFGYNMQLTVEKVISMSSVKNTTILSMIMKLVIVNQKEIGIEIEIHEVEGQEVKHHLHVDMKFDHVSHMLIDLID